MSLLREIQNAATESKVDISTVLRKAKILAARLQYPEFETWVDSELNGYVDRSNLPPYRVLPIEVRGHIARAGLHWNDAPIMSTFLPEKFRAWGEACYCSQPIAALVSAAVSARDGKDQLQVPWPQELAIKFGAEGYDGFECLGAWQVISPHALMGIVDTVRNRLLDFSLKIEAENPEAGEALPGTQPVPGDKVQMIFHNIFYGSVGNVSQNGQDFIQKAR
jgi:hypothetical protein